MKSSASDDDRNDPILQAKRRLETAKINAQLGMGYLQRNNIKRAKAKLLLALKQGPQIPEPWYSMGYFLEATGNKTAANEYYLKAIKVAPDRGDAHNNYGTYLCRQGAYRKSLRHFDMAAHDKTYLDAAAAYENAGLCSMKMKDFHRATRYFRQALQEDPSRSVSLLKLAMSQYQLGDYTQADESMKKYAVFAKQTEESKHFYGKLKETMNYNEAI